MLCTRRCADASLCGVPLDWTVASQAHALGGTACGRLERPTARGQPPLRAPPFSCSPAAVRDGEEVEQLEGPADDVQQAGGQLVGGEWRCAVYKALCGCLAVRRASGLDGS